MPGIASFETIDYNHQMWVKSMQEHQDKPITGMGIFDNNPARVDIDEAATLAGLDVSINCIVNTWGETVSVYAGALEDRKSTRLNSSH